MVTDGIITIPRVSPIFSLIKCASRLTWYGTAEALSLDQVLSREEMEQGKII